MIDTEAIRARFEALSTDLNERARRTLAASEAHAAGHGGNAPSHNRRGKPLLTHQVIVQLIASTTAAKGLTVQCRLDENTYDKGIKVPDAETAKLNIEPADFHGG